MKTSTTKVAGKRTKGRVATTTTVAMTEDVGSYWIGWVQKMRRKVGSKWGISRQHVGLLSKPSSNGKKNGSSCNIMVLLYWFSKARGSLKYKYDASNFKWIDVDSIISTITMTYQPSFQLYALDNIDVECLAEFVFARG